MSPFPVTTATSGFSPAQATDLMERFSYRELIEAGDVALFVLLNFGAAYPLATVARSGPVAPLEHAPDRAIGETRMRVALGDLSLHEYLAHPASRAQAMIVVHRGAIAFEAYPGMRDFDDHVWWSISKTTVSLLLRLLVDEGKVELDAPIDTYLPRLRETDWAGTRVQDILDMASGMDIVETQDARLDPTSTISRFNAAALGAHNADGDVERQFDVIASAGRIRPPGEAFEYSSCNTILLVLMTEALTGRRWHELLRDRVWSKMTVEGDLRVATSPDGIALPYGYVTTRLRDVVRYGLLYTPSWPLAARERIVPDDYVRQIQTSGREEIYLGGEYGNRETTEAFPEDPPSSNAWQWDAIWPDGDIYKAGAFGQGLYVSPTTDLVVAYFSTAPASDLSRYARRIATGLRATGGPTSGATGAIAR